MTVHHPITIGVLGGQGALASATFVYRLVTQWTAAHPCTQDLDFPRILYRSEALPGLTAAGLEDPVAARGVLLYRAADLIEQGADFLVLPCNSLEPLGADIQGHMKVPVLTPLAAARQIRPLQPLTVLMAPATAQKVAGTYPAAWQALDSDLQPFISAAISAVLSGWHTQAQAQLDRAVTVLTAEGKTALLACTELSCLQAKLGAVDAMNDLVSQTINLALTRIAQREYADEPQ